MFKETLKKLVPLSVQLWIENEMEWTFEQFSQKSAKLRKFRTYLGILSHQ